MEQNTSLGFFNTLAGNGLSNLSIAALGITPYITASIIIQLLSEVFPTLKELSRGMRDDRKELEYITLGVGIALAMVEAISISIGFGRQGMTYAIQMCEPRIPIRFATKVPDRRSAVYGPTFLPKNLCIGGVIPIIFTSSLLSFPVLIAEAFGKGDCWWVKLFNTGEWFQATAPIYTFGALLYILLIISFSSFYANMAMSPYEIADNIKKSGGSIPDIRTGIPTIEYLRKQMNSVSLLGVIALS